MNDSEILELIGAKHRDRILDAYARMTSPPAADSSTLTRVLSDMLVQANGAAGLDGAALARRQMEELGIEVAPDYFAPLTERSARNDAIHRAVEDRARFDRAVSTILDGGDEAAAMRLGRLALAEAIDSARAVAAEYMRGTQQVSGWIRQLDSDPCELCTHWSWNGRVWPAGHSMPTHKGCACAQRWVRTAAASVRMVSSKGERYSAERDQVGTLEDRRRLSSDEYRQRLEGMKDGDETPSA